MSPTANSTESQAKRKRRRHTRPKPYPASAPRSVWSLSTPRLDADAERSRVTAKLAGYDVTFEVEGARLEANPEAFASAFLLQALTQGARIESEAPLDPHWRAGIPRILEAYKRWWKITDPDPVVGESRDESVPPETGRSAAACFSLGVDAFHNLATISPTPDILLTNLSNQGPSGYRADAQRRIRSHVLAVAEATGRRALFMRSNLFDHPHFGSPNFYYTHGAALAAMGILLAPEIHTLSIASSDIIPSDYPWGSSWNTDPHHSTQQVEIQHGEAICTRDEKIAVIQNDPVVREHLRVCNNREAHTLNCGTCEKCVRTRLAIRCAGSEDEWPAFGNAPPLVPCIDALSPLPWDADILWRELHLDSLAKEERRATSALFRRSQRDVQRRRVRSLWKSARRIIGA